MSFLSFIIIGNLLFILFNIGETTVCPSKYNSILPTSVLQGCYRVKTSTNVTWSEARQSCINESNTIANNTTGFITHLVALESAAETTALIFWMKAWMIYYPFWIDGVVSSSLWDWSNQSITWYFNSTDLEINGDGTNYKIMYNTTTNTYQIVDDINTKLSYFICEYQDRCNTNNSCQNNATCYLNVGGELCICSPGFTGTTCSQEIDECLSSPCQHGGKCTGRVNNYTCDCSNTFFNGTNCEIPTDDPTQSQRSAAFWSVFGIVCGLVALLTLSDLPWDEMATTIGCPWYRFKCCLNNDNDDDDIDVNNFGLTNSPTNDNNIITKQIIMPGTKSKRGINYHIMNTIWNPEQLHSESPINPQYNGYHSPDPRTTPDNTLIQSYAAVVLAKQKEKQLEEQRIYAVDIIEQNNSTSKIKNPTDTMISWTQQLQEQLKNKQTRPTSASSIKELIQSENINEN